MKTFLVLLVALLLIATVIYLATLNRKNKYVMVVVAAIILLGGFVFYGFGYSYLYTNGEDYTLIEAGLQTARSTIKMFAGDSNLSDIVETPIMSEKISIIIFKLIHFTALIITARAILVYFGDKLIKRLRIYMTRKGHLAIIYGVNEASIDLGNELRNNKDFSVVYIDKKIEEVFAGIIEERIEGLCVSDENAVSPSEKFLEQIGAFKKNRKVVLYAMHKNETNNIEFAKKMNAILKDTKRIPKANASLTILARMDIDFGAKLQATEKEQYGFGSVMELDRPYLAARHLVTYYPPCDHITFDTEKCLATSDFHAIIVGFSKLGQAVLKQLVQTGQFEGSKFHVTVYDPNMDNIMGLINHSTKTMFENYNIELKRIDAKSMEFYQNLLDNSDVSYVATCLPNPEKNMEIALDIQSFMQKEKRDAKVFCCGEDSVYFYDWKKHIQKKTSTCTRETLDIALADARAMVLNYIYCHTNSDVDKEPLDYWINAPYMDKMSSRASADFAKSYCNVMGIDAKTIAKVEKLNVTDEQLDNLAKTEHLRWCAFHYVMGYDKMPEEEFAKKAEAYKTDSSVKINKDNENRLHICLVPWDDLDELSEKVAAATGKVKDYKQDDRNNILMLPKLLKVQ